MDDIDRTNQDLEMYEKSRRSQYKKEAEPTGYCLYCEEPLNDPNKRWCNAECRDAWEKERRMKR